MSVRSFRFLVPGNIRQNPPFCEPPEFVHPNPGKSAAEIWGSHRSTHIAGDLASRALASQAKPQRESAFHIARSKKHPDFSHRRPTSQDFHVFFSGISCDHFRSSEYVFASLAEKKIAWLANWGGAIRIASHIEVASRVWATKISNVWQGDVLEGLSPELCPRNLDR